MEISKTSPVKVILLGAGGTGGHVASHLYRLSHVCSHRKMRVIVCDADIVESKNLVRQNFVLQDVGENKAAVLSRRYANAFGIAVEYVDEYIESDEALQELLLTYNPHELVILIGAVDNNRSRQMCHRVFMQSKNLIYIDSGNGLNNGQVVCGVRQDNKTLLPPICEVYPDILEDNDDKFPSELSCAERNVSAPQSISANLTAATIIVDALYNILYDGEIKTHVTTFSSSRIVVRSTPAIHISKNQKAA